MSSDADSAQLCRFGVVVRNSSGTDLSTMEVRIRVDMEGKSSLLQSSMGTRLVFAQSGSGVFFPATAWTNAARASIARNVCELRAGTSGLSAKAAYQTADDPDNPDPAVPYGGTITSNGTHYPTAFDSLSADTDTKQLVRFGWVVQRTSGSETVYGQITGHVEFGRN